MQISEIVAGLDEQIAEIHAEIRDLQRRAAVLHGAMDRLAAADKAEKAAHERALAG